MIDERFYVRTDIRTIGDLLSVKEISVLVKNAESLPQEADILSVNTLQNAVQGQLAFFDNIKYKDAFKKAQASFVIVRPKFKDIAPDNVTLIESDDPYRLYALCAAHLYNDRNITASIYQDFSQDAFGAWVHKDAVIEENVQTALGVVIHADCQIGSGTIIGSNVVIGRGVTIGRNCIIHAGTQISHSLIGDNVHFLASCMIGQAGFGYALGVSHTTVPQLGRVIIQDSVHIGAGTAVDRGAIDDTVIGEGCKIDNLVQVGHNVQMGRHCVFAGQCAIAGSTHFGDYVICGGQSCFAGHLKISSGARIAGGSAVAKDIPAGETWSGSPAKLSRQHFKEIATLSKLVKQGVKKNV